MLNINLGDNFNRLLLQNYLSAATGSLTRDRANLVLTVLGLAIGLAASFLIALYAVNETSFDKFQPNAERTYRLVMHSAGGNEYALATPQAYQRIAKLPGVADVAMLMNTNWVSSNRVQIGDQYFKLQQSYMAVDNISSFIKFEVLHGDLTQSLKKPLTIALSKTEALRLFGSENAVGRTFISSDSNKTWTVGAVFADMPDNSHFAFHSLRSFGSNLNFRGNLAHYYLTMADNADITQTENAITKIFEDIWQWTDLPYKLQSLLDIHLGKNHTTDMKIGGAQKNVSISIVLSILLLLISCFNTINMSVAQAGSRAKEVGVRKSLGATKSQLLTQFLSESVLLCFIAALIAAVIVEVVLPGFNQLVGRQLSVGNWSEYIGQILSVTLFVGIASGLYPALFIASFNSKKVLSGDFQRGQSAIIVRKSLMILQSAFSIALIVAAISLSLQLKHLQNLPVNYEKHNRMMIVDLPNSETFTPKSLMLYQALAKLDGVASATPIDFDITDQSNGGFFINSIANFDGPKPSLSHGGVGFNAADTLGLKLVAGRDFSSEHPSDWYNRQSNTSAIIIPESLLSVFGYQSAGQAIGQVWLYTVGGAQKVEGTIVGVVKDIKIGSVRTSHQPLVLVCGLSLGSAAIVIKTDATQSPDIQQSISELMAQRLDINPVELQSIEDNYQALYQTDKRLVKMVTVFSTLAIFLTCVGMFGLAAYSAQKRSKEIAIRKVIGASRWSLVNLLAWESIQLVAVSILIAFPAAYYLLEQWLSHFNQRIEQSAVIYLTAAMTITAITWLTVSVIALSRASARPSEVLKSE